MLENPCPQSIEFDAALLRATVLQRGRSREVQFLGGEGLQVAGSVHGIFQARVLEWVAVSFSRESWKGFSELRGCLPGNSP